jgi:hypothetical protein
MDFAICRRCLLTGLLLFAAPLALAQNSDPFRSASPSQSAPTPTTPQPAPPRPGPVVASTLPPAPQIWANVRQVAQAGGILVPLAGNPVFDESGSSPQYRALLGAWGPGTWQGDPAGEKIILVIQSVDASGNARGVVGRSSSDGWFTYTTQIVGNRFTLEVPVTFHNAGYLTRVEKDLWAFEAQPDGSLSATRNGNASSIVLSRLH